MSAHVKLYVPMQQGAGQGQQDEPTQEADDNQANAEAAVNEHKDGEESHQQQADEAADDVDGEHVDQQHDDAIGHVDGNDTTPDNADDSLDLDHADVEHDEPQQPHDNPVKHGQTDGQTPGQTEEKPAEEGTRAASAGKTAAPAPKPAAAKPSTAPADKPSEAPKDIANEGSNDKGNHATKPAPANKSPTATEEQSKSVIDRSALEQADHAEGNDGTEVCQVVAACHGLMVAMHVSGVECGCPTSFKNSFMICCAMYGVLCMQRVLVHIHHAPVCINSYPSLVQQPHESSALEQAMCTIHAGTDPLRQEKGNCI